MKAVLFSVVLFCAAVSSAAAQSALSLHWTEGASLRGQIVPAKEAILSAQMNGQMDELAVQDGDKVTKGAVIARFDCALPLAEAKVADADYRKTLKIAANRTKLVSLKSISKLEADMAKADQDRAAALIAVHKARLRHCAIMAPFSGTISAVHVKSAQYLRVGDPVVTLHTMDQPRVELLMPTTIAQSLPEKARLLMEVDETGQTVALSLSHLSGRFDPLSQSVKAYATVVDADDAGLIVGMTGTVRLAASP